MKLIPYYIIALLLMVIYGQHLYFQQKLVDSKNAIQDIESPGRYVKIDTCYLEKVVASKPKIKYIIKKEVLEPAMDLVPSTIVYEDTLSLDSLGTVSVQDSVRGNQIVDRTYFYQLKFPRITDVASPTLIRTPLSTASPRKEFYAGVGITSQQLLLHSIYGSVIYKDKRNHLYGVSVGYSNQLEWGISTHWKIGRRSP